jgi:hypothetical protein
MNLKHLIADLHKTHRALTDEEVEALLQGDFEQMLSAALTSKPTPAQYSKLREAMYAKAPTR